MGIKDLLRFMKPYITPVHIEKYAGKRVGIDAYSWLHKGAYSCSMELCLDSKSEKKTRFLDYFMHRINLLRHYNITPVVVFDGGSIPCKSATENGRERKRQENRDLAMNKLKEGDVTAATELFQRAISITPVMAHQLIQILRLENIEFVVAPYEADAQLAYLSSLEVDKGGVVAVITEDSDLIAYGCQATIFKMDRYGKGEELLLDKVFNSVTSTPSFRSFDKELFIGMCVLAGCDFLPSIHGIGIAKAYAMVSKYRNLDRVLSVLKIEKGSLVPEDYAKSFREAVAVFRHARIYDAGIKKLRHLTPVTPELLLSVGEELDFLGPEMPPSVATAIAEGHLDPVTMEAFDCFLSPGYQKDHVATQPSRRPKKSEITLVSKADTGFIVFSSRKTSEKVISVVETRMIDTVSTEGQYFHIDSKLQRLVSPFETVKKTGVHEENQLKVPDNNPFKKRKVGTFLDLIKSTSEEVLVLDDDEEKSDILSISLDIKSTFSRKDPGESISNQVSAVTKAEYSKENNTMSSQESVKSKPKRSKGKEFPEKKKTSNGKNSIKSTSILNFFSPL